MATGGEDCVLPQGVLETERLGLLILFVIDAADANLALEVVDLVIGSVRYDFDVSTLNVVFHR